MYGLPIKTRQPNLRKLQFSQSSTVFDSYDFIGGDVADVDRFIDSLPIEDWDGQEVRTFSETRSSDRSLLALDFYELEEWGVWSRTDSPILILPFLVHGVIELRIELMGYGLNIDREITVSVGDASAKIFLSSQMHEISIVLDITSPSRKVEFGNIVARTLDDINDPRTMGVGISQLSIRGFTREKDNWDGEALFVDLANDKDDQLQFGGFNKREKWGIWSQSPECYVSLPYSVHGACEIQIFAQTFGRNKGREICMTLGNSEVRFIAEEEPKQYILRFNTSEVSNLLIINGLAPESTATDSRTLGIGIHRLQMTRPPEAELVPVKKMKMLQINRQPKTTKQPKPATYSLKKQDKVYSALIGDKSENHEWRDVVSAFAWNFRNDKNAVLILKISNSSAAAFFSELMFHFYRIGEMKCRIITIHSLDTQSDVDAIISASHVYLHIDSSIAVEKGLRKIQNTSKISIVSSSEHDKYSGNATILIKPNRRPKKIHGSLFGTEKELEYVLDWSQLVDAVQTAYGLFGKNLK